MHYLLNNKTAVYFLFLLISSFLCQPAFSQDDPLRKIKSSHYGLLSSTGMDMAGYETRIRLEGGLYWYYSFGFMSLVATGLSIHQQFDRNGFVVTAGVGLGAINAAIAYKRILDERQHIELGVGYGGLFGSASAFPYPVISYVYRAKQ